MSEPREVEILAPAQAEGLLRAEVDVAVATARRYPRSIQKFHEELEELVETDTALQENGYYSLNRQGKLIQGPSIRFAECANYAWRNTMVGVRLVGETADSRFVIVQAAGMDLERGIRHSEEIARRIVDKEGRRYSDDMVGMTMRAASAIARREIYLRMVPAALYHPHFNALLHNVLGGLTIEEKVARLAERAKALGISRPRLLREVSKAKLVDLSDRDLLHLHGFLNALEDGMLTQVRPEKVVKKATSVEELIRSATEPVTTTEEGGNE